MISVACSVCGKEALRYPSAVKRRPLAKTFCSPKCRGFSQKIDRQLTTEQFWGKVAIGDTSACWLWQGYKNRLGYGQTRYKGKNILTHRLALSFTDDLWDDKRPVCHSCDQPACCNPAHLWRGTQAENLRDMFAKNRDNHRVLLGEEHGMAKLTAADVADIRASRLSGRKLAEKYGVDRNHINSVKSRRIWRHLP